MAFNESDLELFFLDDNSFTSGTYANYRSALSWVRWGKRTIGVPGDSTASTDTINESASHSAKFLKGRYDSLTDPAGNNLTKDYIIDTSDTLVSGNHPLWQFTWIAIQNRGSDNCYRLGVQCGLTADTPNGSDWSAYINYAQNTAAVRWMGLLDGSIDSTLTDLITNNATFPHSLAVRQRDANYGLLADVTANQNWWQALSSPPTAVSAKKIFHGHNNLITYAHPNASDYATYNPWQVINWIARENSSSNQNRSEQHIMDIPSGKTLIGVMMVTKDSSRHQFGQSEIYMEQVAAGYYGWKISEANVEFDYMVIV